MTKHPARPVRMPGLTQRHPSKRWSLAARRGRWVEHMCRGHATDRILIPIRPGVVPSLFAVVIERIGGGLERQALDLQYTPPSQAPVLEAHSAAWRHL